jgi:peptidyl-prolyl cis-trans isomerase-like 4
LIFSRFGKILSCEVIRDKRTGDSLQYAFIEFEDQASCEQAYFKMQGVLIDDHRIHVDFSQSVSKLSDTWRTATNSKRRMGGGGFGGVSGLEKKRQYKADSEGRGRDRRDRYGMVHDEEELRKRHEREGRSNFENNERSRSRSPRRDYRAYESKDDRRGDRGGGGNTYYGGRDRDRNRERDGRRDREDSYKRR